MGRRALRRIDPSLDLSRHLIELDALARPLDATILFGRQAALEVEVGSGKGLFLSAAATTEPATDFLGIEILNKYARYCAARLARRDLPNARVVHGDAKELFRDVLVDSSLAAVHVYFPDPWWKARHKKRRVMTVDFLQTVERRLLPGGTLHFWTDVEEYFRESLELIMTHTTLSGPHAVIEKPADSDLDYRTHFERRMRLANEPVYRSAFNKPT
jgi:tRNA (guanine-N7-)-methyltransferase